jgi:hypothetical protein
MGAKRREEAYQKGYLAMQPRNSVSGGEKGQGKPIKKEFLFDYNPM